jgi:hypothetical protein
VNHGLALSITRSQTADLEQAEPLLDHCDPEAFLADKAYGASRLIDFVLYRDRNLIERFFN